MKFYNAKVTPEQLRAAADWIELEHRRANGRSQADVELLVDDRMLVVAQGDDKTAFDTGGEVGSDEYVATAPLDRNPPTQRTTPAIRRAAEAMEVRPHTVVDLTNQPHTGERGTMPEGAHRHVAIEWEGGVLWLDMSDQGDHFCIDVRQLRDDQVSEDEIETKEAAVGVFSIIDGRRVRLDDSDIEPRKRINAHGWEACWMPILITDKDGGALKSIPRWNQ